MNAIDLTGLRADNPMGAMAAFGSLRIAERSDLLRGSKLSWKRHAGSFHAVLSTSSPVITSGKLVEILVEDLCATQSRSELCWSEQIKSATEEMYRRAATGASLEVNAWLAAFASDLALDDAQLEPTPFDMSVARQKFLADANSLSKTLASPQGRKGIPPEAAYREALFGPWLYRDDQHSLGWDPSTLKMGAFTFKAPTQMANGGVRAAVWLAFESLPLFPCAYAGRLVTRSFFRTKRELWFRWPVWEEPITLKALETLLGWEELVAKNPDPQQLEMRGVVAVYTSAKYKPNKYLASFRAPELAAGRVLR